MTKQAIAFTGAWNAITGWVNKTAIEKGWWDAERNDGEWMSPANYE